MAHPVKHFITITKHRHRVMRHCFLAGIPFQGLFHDLSKYSLTEFIPGAKYYLGDRSPNEAERAEKAIPPLGSTTRAETATIMNIGWITA